MVALYHRCDTAYVISAPFFGCSRSECCSDLSERKGRRMALSPEAFGHLLTEAVYRIRSIEGKSIAIVQDELGYALGRETGGSAIEYWRKDHIPTIPAEIELLAREIVARTDLGRPWIEAFLRSAGYPEGKRYATSSFRHYRHRSHHHRPSPLRSRCRWRRLWQARRSCIPASSLAATTSCGGSSACSTASRFSTPPSSARSAAARPRCCAT